MSKPAPQVIVIAGPNGAGKTTLAPSLLRDKWRILEYVNADPIAEGLSLEPASVAIEAGRLMLGRIDSLAEQRRTFAFETTLAARSHVGRIRRWIAAGYSFRLMFIWLRSADLAVARVRERVRMHGHNVPEDVVRRRYKAGLKNFWTLYKPLADAWFIYDNSESPKTVPIAWGWKRTPIVAVVDQTGWLDFQKTKP